MIQMRFYSFLLTPDLNRARKFIEMVHTQARKENPNANLPQMLFLKGE
jgi:hypothetical protein